ncbi:ATP-dependent RNA helicase eIF4A [Selaginella moellendorffii]|uniref:ATP-dependent RNA helicase eIF4A n=1 Tax=Selaginella moellendorffii TaxID=88036 RepID=UPI000D1CD73F|nr:ATP-dependent RNA helicase eIF4A [Selaginella moellendorffii]|eukprot:XP_024533962.1 ATP-dependent RNA helicase eIF4A [Selaginella moellendorffii]
MSEASVTPRQRDGDSPRHFYIAVDRQEFKMRTFFDLLEHFWKRSGVPLVICCNARDSLDAVFAAAASCPHFHVKFLHSDLCEHERATTIEEFRRAMAEWRKSEVTMEGDSTMPPKLFLLLVTDACLPSSTFGEHSLLARALVNYDLPVKKEAYLRRLGACLSPSGGTQSVTKSSTNEPSTNGVVLNIVVGGEVSTLRSIEEGCVVIINEMPINITELL